MLEQETRAKSTWETEEEEAPATVVMLGKEKVAMSEMAEQLHPEYKVKTRLVLEDSEKYEWGLVKDCHGCINHIPEDAEIVGTWSKYSDGTFWVGLETSLQALQDKTVLLVAELAKRRALEVPTQKVTTRKPRRITPKPIEEGESAFSDELKKLRENLGQ